MDIQDVLNNATAQAQKARTDVETMFKHRLSLVPPTIREALLDEIYYQSRKGALEAIRDMQAMENEAFQRRYRAELESYARSVRGA